jgi:prepilin-type N-terminal cleavage/methylation domain-containing protein
MNIPKLAILRSRPRTAGFTLIELMITVAIVAILTAIAYPSYRNYVLRGQIVYATNALSAGSANMERVFQDNRTYFAPAAYPTPCPGTTVPTAPATPAGTFSVNCSILLAATANTPAQYTLQAVGAGATAGFTYTIDQSGNQTTSITTPAPSAWIIACPTSWSTKAGQC